jgi:hypothetical protein
VCPLPVCHGDGDTVADTGAAHALAGENRVKYHLGWQIELFGGQFADNFQSPFLAGAMYGASGALDI